MFITGFRSVGWDCAITDALFVVQSMMEYNLLLIAGSDCSVLQLVYTMAS